MRRSRRCSGDRAVVLTASRRADLELRVRYDRDVALAPPRSIDEDRLAPGSPGCGRGPGALRRDRARRGHLHGDDGAAGDRPTTRRRAGSAALSPGRPMTQIRAPPDRPPLSGRPPGLRRRRQRHDARPPCARLVRSRRASNGSGSGPTDCRRPTSFHRRRPGSGAGDRRARARTTREPAGRPGGGRGRAARRLWRVPEPRRPVPDVAGHRARRSRAASRSRPMRPVCTIDWSVRSSRRCPRAPRPAGAADDGIAEPPSRSASGHERASPRQSSGSRTTAAGPVLAAGAQAFRDRRARAREQRPSTARKARSCCRTRAACEDSGSGPTCTVRCFRATRTSRMPSSPPRSAAGRARRAGAARRPARMGRARAAVARLRRTASRDRRVPGWAHRAFDPVRALIGY